MTSLKDNPRFGLNDWQSPWDKEQEKYKYGNNLTDEEKTQLVNKVHIHEEKPTHSHSREENDLYTFCCTM